MLTHLVLAGGTVGRLLALLFAHFAKLEVKKPSFCFTKKQKIEPTKSSGLHSALRRMASRRVVTSFDFSALA